MSKAEAPAGLAKQTAEPHLLALAAAVAFAAVAAPAAEQLLPLQALLLLIWQSLLQIG